MKYNPDKSNSEFEKILLGNETFRRENQEFKKLSESQNPEFVVISCSDSRVSPHVTMDAELGSIFEIRTAGELIDHSSMASVEFAVEKLEVKKLLVVGHTGCGAVSEALNSLSKGHITAQSSDGSELENAVASIAASLLEKPEYSRDPEAAVIHNARTQAQSLMSSAIIRKHVEEGSLLVKIALYDIKNGELRILD